MNGALINRIKSLLWRAGMMGLAVVLAYLGQHLGDLQLPVWAVTIAGLVLGEVSKYLNTKAV